MRTHAVVRGAYERLAPTESVAGSDGLAVATLLSRADGSVDVEVAVCELAPGGVVGGHLHPFEESFFILAGEALLALGGDRHRLVAGDFGFVPVATPHAWRNPGPEAVRWYRVRAPQPRPIGRSTGTFPLADYGPPADGRDVMEMHPLSRFVGHFSHDDLPAPGPLTMPGARRRELAAGGRHLAADRPVRAGGAAPAPRRPHRRARRGARPARVTGHRQGHPGDARADAGIAPLVPLLRRADPRPRGLGDPA